MLSVSNLKMYGCLIVLCCSFTVFAQANTPTNQEEQLGENFSLEGALEMFKTAQSIEDFEQKINDEQNNINNLDLNEDGQIDYVRVIDHVEGEVHALVLQVPLNEKEAQDIAVIEIEKTGKDNAILQIVGDDLLYGNNHYIEPYDVESASGGKGGPSVDFELRRIVVNVWAWPSVRWMYRPVYRPYVSPWRWNHYPRAWRPWRPATLSVFRPRVVRYRPGFRVATTHRVVRAHKVYTPRRRSSTVVASRTVVKRNGNTAVVKKNTVNTKGNGQKRGVQKTTKTAVVNKKGNKVVGKKTTVTKKRGKNGAVGKKKTTVVRGKKRRN